MIKFKFVYETLEGDFLITKPVLLNELLSTEDIQLEFSNGEYVRLNDITSDELIPLRYSEVIDKNDKKIYEGDIIKLTAIDISGSRISKVIFKNGSFVENYFGYSLDCYKKHEIEILGNIYQNPELLEEK